MSLKKFLYYLLEEDGRSNKVQNGVVTTTGTPTPLPNTPDGWQDISLAWERNRNLHGINRSFGRELMFVTDGAHILRDAYYKSNPDRKMFLLIQKLGLQYTDTYYKWLYEYLAKKEIDFSTFNHTQDKVTVSLMDGGLAKLLNAGFDVVEEISLDDPETVFLKMDGIQLQEKANYQLTTELPIEKSVYGTNFYLPATFINREGNLPYIAFLPQVLEATPAAWADKLASENYLAKAADNNRSTISVTITGTIRVTCTDNDPANGFRARFLRSNQDIANQNDYEIFSNATPVAGTSYEYTVNETIPLQPGERLYLEGIYFGAGGTEVSVQFDETSPLTVTYFQRGATSYVPAMTRLSLMRKLCRKRFGHEEYAVSDLLTDGDRLVTSFDAIRGIPGAVIKTSLKEFFEDVDADLCAGLGIEQGDATANLPAGERLKIEARQYFYDPADPVDLGEPGEWEIRSAGDMAISSIKAGWKNPETENVNGKYDFNAAVEFKTPQNRTQRVYEMTSPYKAGCFETEVARIALNGKDSTDNRTDNDNAVFWAERSQNDTTQNLSFVSSGNYIILPSSIEVVEGQKIRITGSSSNDGEYRILSVATIPFIGAHFATVDGTLTDEGPVPVQIEWLEGITYELIRETYDNQGDPDDFGVPDPTTIFNVDLSPKRMIMRHGAWLRGLLYGYDGQKITFSSGVRNTELKTVQGAVTIKENADISISSLEDRYLIPIYLKARTSGDLNLGELLDEGPNKAFQLTVEGVTLTGYNLKAGFAPNEMNDQEYLLLSTADNDFTELI